MPKFHINRKELYNLKQKELVLSAFSFHFLEIVMDNLDPASIISHLSFQGGGGNISGDGGLAYACDCGHCEYCQQKAKTA